MAHNKLIKTRSQYRPKQENTKAYNSARWDRTRKAKVRDCPLCEICLQTGRTTPADVVHHVKPWQLGTGEEERDWLMFDYDNLQSLCHECHSAIHHKLRIAAAYERKRPQEGRGSLRNN